MTKECVQYIVEFYNKHFKFNKWFKYSFPTNEMYFVTVVMNSNLKQSTMARGSEPEKRGLVNWRNLHYFEYPEKIRVFNDNDFEFLSKREELFVRKVNTQESTKLLDLLDSIK